MQVGRKFEPRSSSSRMFLGMASSSDSVVCTEEPGCETTNWPRPEQGTGAVREACSWPQTTKSSQLGRCSSETEDLAARAAWFWWMKNRLNQSASDSPGRFHVTSPGVVIMRYSRASRM